MLVEHFMDQALFLQVLIHLNPGVITPLYRREKQRCEVVHGGAVAEPGFKMRSLASQPLLSPTRGRSVGVVGADQVPSTDRAPLTAH